MLGELMKNKETMLLTQRMLARTSVACFVSAVLAGCGAGANSEDNRQDRGNNAFVRGVIESPQLAFVERDMVSQQEAALSEVTASMSVGTLATGSKFSPFAVNRGAKLILRESLDVEADQTDLMLQKLGWNDYDAKDISVSADGTKILFAAIGPAGNDDGLTWNIYEYDQETDTLRRIIADSAVANLGNDVSPAYGPNGEIVFSSDRSAGPINSTGGTFEQDSQTCYVVPQGENGGVLHVMSPTGENIESLTSGLHYDVESTLLSDGQIAFVRVSDHYETVSSCDVNGTIADTVECQDAVSTPAGAVIPGIKVQLMRIDLNDRRADLMYEPVILLGDDANFEIDKISQLENGNIGALVRHSHLTHAGGTILTFGAPENADASQTFGNLAPTALIQPLADVVPLTISISGWISAFSPAYDGTGRIIKSWAQCVLEANGVNSFCDESTSINNPNLQINYELWFYDTNTDTSVPLVTDTGKQYSDLALMQRQLSATWPHEAFMPDYPLETNDESVVCDGNTTPIANAGPDQEVQWGSIALLSGAGSFDVEGDLLSYQWRILRQPEGSAASLSDSAAVSPNFNASTLGEYEFELVVSDGETTSQPDIVVITAVDAPVVQLDPYRPDVHNPNDEPRIEAPINDDPINYVPPLLVNNAPVANAGPDQSAKLGDAITLDGSNSSDPDGDVITYVWQVEKMPEGTAVTLNNPTDARPDFTLMASGSYEFSLTVSDGELASTDTVVISTENLPPVANAGNDVEIMMYETISLDGSASYDPEGAPITTYSWSIFSSPDGSPALSDANTKTPSFTGTAPGVYLVDLVVNDGELDSPPDRVQIVVKEGDMNRKPIADAGDEQYAELGEVVTLDGSGSFDPDDDVLTYRWALTVPEGSAATLDDVTAVQPKFTADAKGTYVAQLIVNDGVIDSEADTVAVSTVNAKPIADAGHDVETKADEVQLDGTGSRDPDGDELTYEWWVSSVPAGADAPTLENADSAQPTLKDLDAGEYIISLRVNDGYVDSDVDQVSVRKLIDDIEECDDEDDRQEPKLHVTPDQNYLWPPNGKYVTITLEAYFIDACGMMVPVDVNNIRAISGTSNQPDNCTGCGDGNTVDDIKLNVDPNNPLVVELRAERQGGDKAGRTYTLVYEATVNGMAVQTETQIYVKHDQGKRSGDDD
jgi:hypothetical protein